MRPDEPDKRLDAQPPAPEAQRFRGEGAYRRLQKGACLAVAVEQLIQGLRMGEVQAASASEKELARRLAMMVDDLDAKASRCQHFCRHEACGTCADHPNIKNISRHDCGLTASWGEGQCQSVTRHLRSTPLKEV
jgi:hypothetical protein